MEIEQPSSTEQELPPSGRRAFETLLNISIASLGGVIAGISIARQKSKSFNTNNNITLTKLKHHQRRKNIPAYVDHNLPIKWAIACGSFVGVLDVIVRWICPITESLKYLNPSNISSNSSSNHKNNAMINQAFGTIGDYTVAGAVAGAIFKGSAIRSSTTTFNNKRFPSSNSMNFNNSMNNLKLSQGRIFAGLFPGMILGCFAGITVFSFIVLQDYIEDVLEKEEQRMDAYEKRIEEEKTTVTDSKEDEDDR